MVWRGVAQWPDGCYNRASSGDFERESGVGGLSEGQRVFSISSLPAPATIIREDPPFWGVFFISEAGRPRDELIKNNPLILRSKSLLSPLFSVAGCHRVPCSGRGFIAGLIVSVARISV